jgi:threonine efflux protein
MIVLSQLAAAGQRRSACLAALGITVVAGLWSSLAILGVSAVFAAYPYLRLAVQIAGGLYLCYAATRLWRSSFGTHIASSKPLTPVAAFRIGFLTNLSNPKSAAFFGSVFATALPLHPSVATVIAVIALVIVNALAWHLFLAVAFSHRWVQSAYTTQRDLLTRSSAAVVGAFGFGLLGASLREAIRGRS